MKSILGLLPSPAFGLFTILLPAFGLLAGTVAYAQIAPPGNLSPAEPGAPISLTLSWDPVDPGANGPAVYNVRVVDKTDAGIQDPRNNCQPVPTLAVVPYLCVDGLTDAFILLPVKAGHSYDWSVQAIDSAGNRSGLATASFSVSMPLELTTKLLPDGKVGQPYGAPLPASTSGPVALRAAIVAGAPRILAIGADPRQEKGRAGTGRGAAPAPADKSASSLADKPTHLVDDSQAFSPQLAGIAVFSHASGPPGTAIVIYGSHLRSSGFFVSFGLATGGTMPVDGHYVKFLDDTRLLVVVPPNLPLGVHDLHAEFPAMGWKGKLTSAFTVTAK